MGDDTIPVTDSYDGDGISYVSGIRSCKADSNGKTIVGLQFTLTSTISGKSTARALEGYEGVCDDTQAVSLSGSDCFQMLNLVTDTDGNTAALGFKRSGSEDVEYIGYGDTDLYDGVNTVDFGSEGCLTGYRLAFESSSGRRLNTGPAELKGMSAVSNPSLQDSVASTAALLSDATAGIQVAADGKSDLLLSDLGAGQFNWDKKEDITQISSCSDGSSPGVYGLRMKFADGD